MITGWGGCEGADGYLALHALRGDYRSLEKARCICQKVMLSTPPPINMNWQYFPFAFFRVGWGLRQNDLGPNALLSHSPLTPTTFLTFALWPPLRISCGGYRLLSHYVYSGMALFNMSEYEAILSAAILPVWDLLIIVDWAKGIYGKLWPNVASLWGFLPINSI